MFTLFTFSIGMQITRSQKSEVFKEEEEEKQIMKPDKDKDLNINKGTRHKLKR